MNYEKIYNSIIEKRKLNVPIGYVEEHHIVPSSIGGTNEKSNLVCLTAKEHFICHLLLTKIYKYGTLEFIDGQTIYGYNSFYGSSLIFNRKDIRILGHE